MYLNNKILVGKSGDKELSILLDKANRHGLITGASGSGKTITLKVMAESFSDAGVPVFLADVKGDIAGTCLPGEESDKIKERLNSIGIKKFDFKGFPIHFWDIYFLHNYHNIWLVNLNLMLQKRHLFVCIYKICYFFLFLTIMKNVNKILKKYIEFLCIIQEYIHNCFCKNNHLRSWL